MATQRVGGEVDAFCTRCKLLLGHTVLALEGGKIARVRCNTCHSDRTYRPTAGSSSRAPSSSREKPAKVVVSFDERLAGTDLARTPPYSPKRTYEKGQVLHHSTFGYGIVTSVRSDKIDVDFKSAQKTLVHGRSGAAAPRPSFHPPHSPAQGPADKPVGPHANRASSRIESPGESDPPD